MLDLSKRTHSIRYLENFCAKQIFLAVLDFLLRESCSSGFFLAQAGFYDTYDGFERLL
ncbi:MAG: hypothetical protein OXN83_05295 [Oligoflexia bacterium]|nr:hypothetical protein [Oligoflexia bacterium]